MLRQFGNGKAKKNGRDCNLNTLKPIFFGKNLTQLFLNSSLHLISEKVIKFGIFFKYLIIEFISVLVVNRSI